MVGSSLLTRAAAAAAPTIAARLADEGWEAPAAARPGITPRNTAPQRRIAPPAAPARPTDGGMAELTSDGPRAVSSAPRWRRLIGRGR